MNRIGIFCFYDKDGIVDKHTEYLLDEISKFTKKLIIVINGDIQDYEYTKLKKRAYFIIKRKNIGYDGGAYKDIFLNYIREDMLINIDEIILFNSSFWGPVNSFEHLFKVMDNIAIDFWGLTKWLDGPSSMPDYPVLPEHIQAYFLGIRSSILRAQSFMLFWRQMNMPKSYDEAIRNFEISFTRFFSKQSFRYTTYIDEYKGREYLEPGKVVYISHGGDLVVNCDFPIIKKKIIDFSILDQVMKLDLYLKHNDRFNNLIKIEIEQKENEFLPYNNLENFYTKHNRIFVFGHGQWGKNIESYFLYKGWKINSFILSNNADTDNNEVNLDDIELLQSDGIIVALSKSNIKDVYNLIIKKIDKSNLLLPKYAEKS